jgi:DNA (cytosine-5)-methyltransferase 1
MKVLDLFSGIGGFSLGLERAGFTTVAFCEIEPFCRAVLKKHWPHVPCYEDVRTLTAERLAADGISVDVICGGFPCQDISFAGKGAGIEGERSGLWREYARLIGELRPRYVIVENVAALLGRGLDVVLGDLSEIGFDAEWHCIPASYVGAPHLRDRIWIVAYPNTDLHAHRLDCGRDCCATSRGQGGDSIQGQAQHGEWLRSQSGAGSPTVANTNRKPAIWAAIARQECAAWDAEPSVGRVVDGLSFKLVEPELKALGNAVVPQIPELIGRAILAAEAA